MSIPIRILIELETARLASEITFYFIKINPPISNLYECVD